MWKPPATRSQLNINSLKLNKIKIKAVTVSTVHVLSAHLRLVDPILDSLVRDFFYDHINFWKVLV